uniref:Guanine nucleotide-binding protein G(O) subunit alpha n=1 Tax=Meloidogyne hapla TaxID=6305 RepID=A0A1I8BP76_MELHA
MIESLRLFRSVCNSRWFYNTAMILFLNKKDIFAEKIKTISIQCLFKNYMGQNTYEDQVRYIEDKFSSLNSNPNKTIYIHETCATDTNQSAARVVLDIVRKGEESEPYSDELLHAIKALWADRNMKEKVLPRGQEFQLVENSK